MARGGGVVISAGDIYIYIINVRIFVGVGLDYYTCNWVAPRAVIFLFFEERKRYVHYQRNFPQISTRFLRM